VIAGLRAEVAALAGRLASGERLASGTRGIRRCLLPVMMCCRAASRRPGGNTSPGRGAAGRARAVPCRGRRSRTRRCAIASRASAGAGGLAGAADAGIERSHHGHDQPPVAAQITQHDVRRVRCGCGPEHAGALPAHVATVPSSYGVNLSALVTYLIVYQHVPVQRCVQLVADLAGWTGPSAGFCHGMLSRCAAVLADVTKLIKAAVTLAAVAGFDETPLRCGPAGPKKYVLSGSTETAVAYYLGGRDPGSFEAFGILPSFAGIAVHDRYSCYFHRSWQNIAGHQAPAGLTCCAGRVPASSKEPSRRRAPAWRQYCSSVVRQALRRRGPIPCMRVEGKPCACPERWYWPPSTTAGRSPFPGLNPNQTRVSGSTGFCLDVPGAQTTPGLQLQTWRCNGTLAQQFWVVQ
jgi:hypothetical protein